MIISFFNLINYVSVKSHENNAVISIKKLPVSDVLIKQKMCRPNVQERFCGNFSLKNLSFFTGKRSLILSALTLGYSHNADRRSMPIRPWTFLNKFWIKAEWLADLFPSVNTPSLIHKLLLNLLGLTGKNKKFICKTLWFMFIILWT